MMFRFAFLSTVLASANAISSINSGADITASSKLGSKLLSKARMLENAEEENTWIAGYSLKFDSCHTIDSYGGEEADRNREEGGSPFASQHLVRFRLCPTEYCKAGTSTCKNGAEYVVNMREFVESYTEAKQEAQEYNCELVRENCDCEYYYGDDEACEAKCFAEAGLDYCGEDEDEFEVQEYVECREAEFGNNNNNNNNNNNAQYYIGPYCANNGNSILLGIFTDATCSTTAPSGVYEKYNYGKALPYSQENLVDKSCHSCMEPKEERDDDQAEEEEDEVIEMCNELYEQSGKCEKNLKDKYYTDTNSCTFIETVLPALEKVHKTSGKNGRTTTFFAWFFFLTTCALGGAAFYLHQKVERSSVGLTAEGEGTMA